MASSRNGFKSIQAKETILAGTAMSQNFWQAEELAGGWAAPRPVRTAEVQAPPAWPGPGVGRDGPHEGPYL